MSAINSLLNGGSAIGLGGYLVGVTYKGNVKELGGLLYEETGYIDFVAALFILGSIQKYGPTSKVANILIAITLVGLAIKVGNNNTLLTAITDFASGNKTIVETFKSITGI